MSSSPHALFFTSEPQRTALARQRYFEEGIVPSGLVKREVLDSWARCQRLRFQTSAALEFNEVSPSRVHLALQRNRLLIEAWTDETQEIERTLAGTHCSAILTDATGVLVASTGVSDSQARITQVAHRVGINLAEEAVGTSAPGMVLKTGQAVTVLGGEHFFDKVRPMYCAAAPIHNLHGELAGVLDISSEHKPFEFDVAAVVALYASCIENRLFLAQSREHLVVRMQVSPSLLDTPMTGLAGVNTHGHLVWTNGVASRMLGQLNRPQVKSQMSVEDLFGLPLNRLLALNRPTPMRLANGLSVWLRVDPPAHNGLSNNLHSTIASQESPRTAEADTAQPEAMLPTAESSPDQSGVVAMRVGTSLKDLDKELIQRTVEACKGNVSHAARQLGVSRGLIYRRLRAETESDH